MPEADVTNDVVTTVDPGLSEDSDPREPDEDRRRGLWAVLLVFVILLAIAIWIWVNTAVVPDVVGLDADDARARIEKAGFDVGDVMSTDRYSVEPGQIEDQGPEGGKRVLKGTDVVLVLAVATGAPEVPEIDEGDLFGGAGGYDFSDRKTANVPDNYDVSRGSGEYKKAYDRVPQALNLTESAGRAVLTGAGYRLDVHYGLNAGGIADGRIFYQNPPPGAYESPGTVVEIWVSTGSPPPREDGGLYPQPGKP